mgnify:CR=1 FL=1|jgi:hypothetical protein
MKEVSRMAKGKYQEWLEPKVAKDRGMGERRTDR